MCALFPRVLIRDAKWTGSFGMTCYHHQVVYRLSANSKRECHNKHCIEFIYTKKKNDDDDDNSNSSNSSNSNNGKWVFVFF